ncbi:hypothetical protein [Rossellomorea marisflavi]|uniref:hypothetical protein n=1 Tax=Rossellomorea marisflavi TaxID=189381 RepID=UPI003459994E
MSKASILTLYKEYNNILALLDGKPFEVIENNDLLVITLDRKFDLHLLKEIGELKENFNYSLNPMSDSYDVVLEDLESGNIRIEEIESIALDLQKNVAIDQMDNVDLIFFNMHEIIKSLKDSSQYLELNKFKTNIGIFYSECFETDLLNFVDISNGDTDKAVRKKIDTQIIENLDFYLSNNKRLNQTRLYNPYTFTIKNVTDLESNSLMDLMKREFYYTMLECISDKNDNMHYIIRGEKNVNLAIRDDFTTNNYEMFLQIFLFLISQKKYTEKFIIIKKVITLYINENEDITQFDLKLVDIWKTINHYYNHYIEDNIKEFFKTKDQLLKEAMSASKVIYEQTDKVINSIIASILSVLIIIVSTLFRSVSTINLTLVIAFLIIFVPFSIVFHIITKKSSISRYTLTKNQFDHFINEISLIPENEVAQIRKTYLMEPYKELQKSIQRLKMSLIVFNILFIIGTFVYIGIEFNLYEDIIESVKTKDQIIIILKKLF